MPVIKKTIALHPVMDRFVRKMWAILIENGYDASYSTALNYMLLEHIRSVEEDGISQEVNDDLADFMADESTITDLNLEDYASVVDDLFAKKEKTGKRGQ
jgi:hypothetical protein